MLRRRRVNIKTVKELDAFPKVPETYVDKTAVGGTFSLFTICIIIYLILAETMYFLDSKWRFKFEPDHDIDSKLKINVDITVAMKCNQIDADVADSTNENMMGHNSLEKENTWWELTQEQRSYFDVAKHINHYFRGEYHAIHELLWKSNQLPLFNEMPKRKSEPNYASNACRIHGSLLLNKVSGNFHIAPGKSLSLPSGHVHISAFMSTQDYNFTHRIHKFSFGEPSSGIVHPLEGDEKIADDNLMMYQYFIGIVPTDIETLLGTSKAYQYSVKDYQRPIDHEKGSHGMAGIFFKYDTSALKIKVIQQRDTIFQFLVKLCATVGGIFVTIGLIKSIVQGMLLIGDTFFSKSDKTGYKKLLDSKETASQPPVISLHSLNPPPINLNIVSNSE